MKIDVYENMYIFWSLIYTVREVLNSLIFSIIASVLGMLHNWTEFFMEVVCCKFKLGKYETKDIITNNSGGSAPASLTENASSNLPNVNLYSSPNSWPQLVETREGSSCCYADTLQELNHLFYFRNIRNLLLNQLILSTGMSAIYLQISCIYFFLNLWIPRSVCIS